MEQLVLGGDGVVRCMKAMRFHLVVPPGRLIAHAKETIIHLGAGTTALAELLDARRIIRDLAAGLAG